MPKPSSKISSDKSARPTGTVPKKRQRISSDEDYVPEFEVEGLDSSMEAGSSKSSSRVRGGDGRRSSRGGAGGEGVSSRGRTSRTTNKSKIKPERAKRESQSYDADGGRSELRRCHQKLRKMEGEKRKMEERLEKKRKLLLAEQVKNGQKDRDLERVGRDLDKARREKNKLKQANEKLVKDAADQSVAAMNDVQRWRQKSESLKKKLNKTELEKVKLESKISSLGACGSDAVAGPSTSGSGTLFQDMMDNFRELAETQLQCAVCNELFVEAVSINCGHTFCNFCIGQWKKKKNNCPVCRTDITQQTDVKVLDDYVDKVYDQFVSEAGRQQRNSLKEDRKKAKRDEANKAQQRVMQRRERAQARRNNGLELVNIVLNRAGRGRDDDESSLDSDVTLELHLSDGQEFNDTDTESRSNSPDRLNLSSLYVDEALNSDTDSSDDSFRAGGGSGRNNDSDSDDTNSLPDTNSDRSDSSSDSSRSNSSSTDSSSDSDSDF